MRKIDIKIYRELQYGKIDYLGKFKLQIDGSFWDEFYLFLIKILKKKKIRNKAQRFIVFYREDDYQEIFIYRDKVKLVPDMFIQENLVRLILKNQKWFIKKAFEGVIE